MRQARCYEACRFRWVSWDVDGEVESTSEDRPAAGARAEGVEGEERAGELKAVKGVGWASEDLAAALTRGLGVCIL